MSDEYWNKSSGQTKVLDEFQGPDEKLARQLLALRRSPRVALLGRVRALRLSESSDARGPVVLRPRRLPQQIVFVRTTLLLLLIVVLVLGLPTLQATAGAAVRALADALIGMTSSRSGVVTFTPPPPFVVQQPDHLSDGWRLVAERYAALDAQSGSAVNAGPNVPTGANTSDTIQQAVEHQRGDFAYIVLGYQGPDQLYYVVFERAAQHGESLPMGEARTVKNQAAILLSQGSTNSLVWMDGGTRIELESNLSGDGLVSIANKFAATQSPEQGSSSSTPSGMVITSHVVQPVSLAEAQAQVTFHIPTFGWVPDGFHLGGAHVSPPDWANIYYVPSDPALAANYAGFGLAITRGKDTSTSHIEGTQPQPDILVNGLPATYTAGPSVGELRWEASGFTFDLSYSGLDLSRDEVQRLAESLH